MFAIVLQRKFMRHLKFATWSPLRLFSIMKKKVKDYDTSRNIIIAPVTDYLLWLLLYWLVLGLLLNNFLVAFLFAAMTILIVFLLVER